LILQASEEGSELRAGALTSQLRALVLDTDLPSAAAGAHDKRVRVVAPDAPAPSPAPASAASSAAALHVEEGGCEAVEPGGLEGGTYYLPPPAAARGDEPRAARLRLGTAARASRDAAAAAIGDASAPAADGDVAALGKKLEASEEQAGVYRRVLDALGVHGDQEAELRVAVVKVREAAAQAPSLQLELQALQASFDALVLENMRLKTSSSSSSSEPEAAPSPASSDQEDWAREKEELEAQVRELSKVAKALEEQVDKQDDIILRLQDSEDSAMLRAEEVLPFSLRA